MTTIHQMNLIPRQIDKLGAAYATPPDYRSSLLSLLREAVPFDAGCCTHADPKTLLRIASERGSIWINLNERGDYNDSQLY
ncbi:hypothetical protein [Paenibacillus thiaminolyticus]|uniref:hypothetical protein n=1 Tax=Paenibacillus thiaminolyticus TaxID=49283 RepID=UPI002543F083|nr:hypothetical protein [Paenibacillus thiaminolyticus]WII35210.1 hypothetical protein O0V01_16000 [Paenibacillus thiaminolyticus]